MRLRTFFAVAIVALAACDEETTGRPTCDALGETCHDADTPAGIECHEFVEDSATTEEQCVAKESECVAICEGAGSSS
jgi:hypothetical protein